MSVVEQVTVEQVTVVVVEQLVVPQAGPPQNSVPQPPQSWKVVPQLAVDVAQLVLQTCTAHEVTLPPPLSMTSGLQADAETSSTDARTASKVLSMTTPSSAAAAAW